MNTATCGFIAQHAWELPQVPQTNQYDGHSLQDRLCPYFRTLIQEQDIQQFLVSMELGPAMDAAEAILHLRDEFPLTLECTLPFEELHAEWPEHERSRFFSIMKRCDRETLVQRPFSLDCYKKTAQHIISNSTDLLVLWNGCASDAGDAVNLARKHNRQVQVLDVMTLLSVKS